MGERWFTDDELREMSRPTMDSAIEALRRGDTATQRGLCEAVKYGGGSLHDLMVEGVAGLISYVQEKFGDDGVAEAWRYSSERGWKRDVETIARMDRRAVAQALAATWRAHSGSGTGPNPGAFSVTEDDEKLTFSMNPCGSGQRLVRNHRYEGPDAFGTTEERPDGSAARRTSPLYCTHCAYMNESLPIEWIAHPLYPSHPPDDFHTDPC